MASAARAAAVALDVGGTKVAAGLVAADGTLLHEQSELHTLEERRTRPGLGLTLDSARAMLALAAERGVDVVGVGAGFPEYVGADGRLRSSDVVSWPVQPQDALAELAGGLPCAVGSDVRVAALGEARCGAGAGLESFLYVTLGTGLSCTLVLGGVPWAGARGEAIALGELGVPASVDPSWRGNVEQFASGRGIATRSAAPGRAADGTDEVTRRAADGDAEAAQLLSSAGRALGIVVAEMVWVLDPAAVVIGGGLGSAQTPLHDALETAYAEHLVSRPEPPPLRLAALGARAGLVGAGLLAHDLAETAHPGGVPA